LTPNKSFQIIVAFSGLLFIGTSMLAMGKSLAMT